MLAELAASMVTARADLQHSRATCPHIQPVWTGLPEAGTRTRSKLLALQELIAAIEDAIVTRTMWLIQLQIDQQIVVTDAHENRCSLSAMHRAYACTPSGPRSG